LPQPRFSPEKQKSRQIRESIWHPLVALLLPAATGEQAIKPKDSPDLHGSQPDLMVEKTVSSSSYLLSVCNREYWDKELRGIHDKGSLRNIHAPIKSCNKEQCG